MNRQQNQKPIAAGKSSFELIDRERLFRELDIKEDTVILDAACGRGNYALAMAPFCTKGKIFAFDLWQEGIDHLNQAAADAHFSNIIPVIADISKYIPIDNASVDICLLATVLHDLVQDGTDQRSLGEIKRILKPDGVLAVIEFKKISGPPGPPVGIRLSPEELEGLVTPHGFRAMKTMEIGAYNYLTIFQ